MKYLILFAASLIASAAQAANFQCDNMPSSRWGNFYCVYGELNGSEITYLTFGICAGSAEAGEMDPIEEFEFKDGVKTDPTKKATSPQWKNANAYDVSSPELGKVTLFIPPETFTESGYTLGRVKRTIDGKTKNTQINCSSNRN